MEQHELSTNEAPEINESLCLNCQARPYVEGHSTKLCAECRVKLINFPIPKWIWIFTGIIVLMMLWGMVRMPLYLGTALHLGRAEKAMNQKHYVTALHELEKVIAHFPQNTECLTRIVICNARNMEFDKMSVALSALEGKKIEDKDLYNEVQNTINKMSLYYETDTLLARRINDAFDSAQALLAIYSEIANDKSDAANLGAVMIASNLYDLNNYSEAEKIINAVLANNASCYPALTLQIAVKRNLRKFDEAVALCDKMLEENKENVNALCQRARVELKRGNDAVAARYATQAMQLVPENTVVLETKALVEYLAGHKEESMLLFKKIKTLETPGDTVISTRLAVILSGQEKYR